MEGKLLSLFGVENWSVGLSGLKSELLCEFHYNNNWLLLFFLVVILALISLEFPNSEISGYLC
jgi:hypothetical protein